VLKNSWDEIEKNIDLLICSSLRISNSNLPNFYYIAYIMYTRISLYFIIEIRQNIVCAWRR